MIKSRFASAGISLFCVGISFKRLSSIFNSFLPCSKVTPEALEILKNKRKGTYNVIKIDPAYRPAPIEHKDVFGVTFEQGRAEHQYVIFID